MEGKSIYTWQNNKEALKSIEKVLKSNPSTWMR
jgi:hypothetical protein